MLQSRCPEFSSLYDGNAYTMNTQYGFEQIKVYNLSVQEGHATTRALGAHAPHLSFSLDLGRRAACNSPGEKIAQN